MKTKLLPLLLLMFITGQSFSQPYIPVLDNASWIVKVYYFGGSQTFTISQSGEQTVGAHTYKKFVRSGTSTEFLLREDIAAKKVYKLINNADVLFFDFNLNVSDNITLSNGQNYQVISISNINVNGGQRRQWYLNNNSPFGYDEVWIEGVGNKEQPVMARYEWPSDPAYGLQCSSQNGVFVYNQGLANGGAPTDCVALGVTEYDDAIASKISFTPNPFRTELTINTTVRLQDATLNVYNTLGQMVKQMNHLNGNKILLNRENLNPGIYLIQLSQNGKLLASKKVSLMD